MIITRFLELLPLGVKAVILTIVVQVASLTWSHAKPGSISLDRSVLDGAHALELFIARDVMRLLDALLLVFDLEHHQLVEVVKVKLYDSKGCGRAPAGRLAGHCVVLVHEAALGVAHFVVYDRVHVVWEALVVRRVLLLGCGVRVPQILQINLLLLLLVYFDAITGREAESI